jgi:hypothetical protein
LANTGDSNFDVAKVSTLFVSTITSLDGQSLMNIKNLSSIVVSTFRNFVVNSENIQTTAKLNNFNFLNGTYALTNRDFNTGLTDPVANLTNITTGTGSFQALTGALTLAATTSTLNLFAGNDGINISGDARFLTGFLNMCNNSISNVTNFTATNSAINSISSLRTSTGSAYIATSAIDSISSLRISTGTARVGVANIGTLTVGAVTLSGNLDMCNNNINNVATLTATTVNAGTVGAIAGNFTTLSGTLTGNVNGNLTGNVVGNISNTTLNLLGQYSITETADVGSAISNYGNYGTVNISGKGGLGSLVNITADSATPLNPAVTTSQLTVEAKGNYGLITPGSPIGYVPRGGLVSIIARQGLTPTPPAEVTSALFANGEIDITAFSYGLVPGLIKLSSGANAMYAGGISPLTGIYGNNYIFGQFGNSILAGLPPGGVPNVPGENYLYALTGTVIENGLYTDTIYNKFGGNLNLDSRSSNITITSSNTGGTLTLTSPTITLTGSSAINLTGNPTISGNLDMTDGNINNVANIFSRPGSNMTIQSSESILSFPTTALIYATGGTITESGGRTFHTFTTDGTFTLNYSVGTVEVMVIGGGGGGGGVSGGGGGAGNMVVVEDALAVGSYTVTIGPGGAGGTVSTNGGNGTQSRFNNSTSSINIRGLGGGGGSTELVAGGESGGCGGGGSGGTESFGGVAGTGSTTGMTTITNAAFDGGSNPGPGNAGPAGSGGGGVFSVGQDVSAITPSDGGDGGGALLYYGTYYGGGGGGSAAPSGVYGTPRKGRGGGTAPPQSGGNGSLGANSEQAQPGVANTGGGGGGGEDATGGYAGAAGGSGIVIVSYLTPPAPQFTMGTIEEILLSTSKVTVSNDLTVLGTTNIQATTVSTISVTNISTIGTAAFGGDVYLAGPSTIVSELFDSNGNQILTFVQGQSGSTQAGSFSINSPQQNVEFNGRTFPIADWNCSASLGGFSIPSPYAVNQAYVTVTQPGGFWAIQSLMNLATLPVGGVGVQWSVTITMTPKGLIGPSQLGSLPPSTLSTTDFALNIPFTFMSSMTGSTMTIQADENLSILANLTPQPFVSTGNITIAGTNVVGMIGDTTVIAGISQISINCDPGDVNIVATSTISLSAGSNVSIQDMTFTTNNLYNWSGGTIHTLYGDVINGGKYLQWMYDNNPGTLMADNSGITIDAPEVKIDVNDVNIYSYGSQAFRFVKEDPYNYLQTVDRPMIITGLGGANHAFSFDGTGSNKSFRNLDMCNNNINNTQTLTTSTILVSSITGNPDINLTGLTNLNGNLDMCNNNIKTVGLFSRMLSSTSVDQPILQYGTETTSGNNGSVVVNLTVSYTSATSYVAFATMEDADPAEMSVVRVSATSIEVYWAQGGGGSHLIAWNTMGT